MKLNKSNSFWLAIQYSISLIFSLIILKLNLSFFGSILFGYWILIASLWGFGRALDFGLGTSLVKFVAEYNYRDSSRLTTLLSSAFYLFLVFGIVIFFVICGIAKVLYFSNQNIISSEYHPLLWNVLIVLGLSFYLNYISNFFRAAFEGLNKFVIISKINIVFSSLILVSVIITYLFELSLLLLAFLYLFSSLITLFLFIISFRVQFLLIIPLWKEVKISTIKDVLSYSIAIQGAAIFSSLIDPLIKYLLGSFSSIGTVSVYEIAKRFVVAITGLFNATFRPILPRSSILFSRDEYQEFVYKDCVKLSGIGVTYSGFIFGVGSLIIPVLIREIFGYDEAVLIYLILAIPESINKFGYPIYNFLIGIGRAYFISLVQLINIFIIAFSVFIGLVILQSSLGLLGYGFTVLVMNFVMIGFAKKVSGISIGIYFKRSYAYKLLLLVLFLLFSIFLIYNNYLSINLTMLGLGVIALILFLKDATNFSTEIFKKLFSQEDA